MSHYLGIPTFATKLETIKWVVANKKELISVKKAAIKHCEPYTTSLTINKRSAFKADNSTNDTDDVIRRTIVGNTYYWMDSHEDVHVSNNFAKSIKESKGRIFHRHDHINQVTAKVGRFDKVYEESIKWSDLGVNKTGKTEAIMADSDIMRVYNESVFQQYKDGDIDQHSVGMYYVKLDVAANDPSSKEEYKNWLEVYPKLGNPEKADEAGYMFIVREARLIEISAVTNGSNSLTPTLEAKTIEALEAENKELQDELKELKGLKEEPTPVTLEEIEPLPLNSTQLLHGLLKQFKK